jgi:hypothetical protein
MQRSNRYNVPSRRAEVCFTEAGSTFRHKKALRGLRVEASFAIETPGGVPTVDARESIEFGRNEA